MRNLLILLILLFCTQCTQAPAPEELASLAAKGYYEHLVAGDYKDFLDGRVGMDAAPDGYRAELMRACEQYMADQQRAHQGVREVAVSNVRTDSTSHCINVFLLLSFGDGAQEEVVVPMVEHDGRWRMK